MPSVPAPADPGWGEDPAWPDRDPVTAAEREARLDRLCAQDDDPFDAPEEYWDPVGRDLHQPCVPATRRPVRLRAQCAVRGGRAELLV